MRGIGNLSASLSTVQATKNPPEADDSLPLPHTLEEEGKDGKLMERIERMDLLALFNGLLGFSVDSKTL